MTKILLEEVGAVCDGFGLRIGDHHEELLDIIIGDVHGDENFNGQQGVALLVFAFLMLELVFVHRLWRLFVEYRRIDNAQNSVCGVRASVVRRR